MKIEEAIAEIKESGLYGNQVHMETLQLAIEALEKQIAKKPKSDDNGGCEYYESWLECPDCREAVPEYTEQNETKCFCVRCGQKLDWGVE